MPELHSLNRLWFIQQTRTGDMGRSKMEVQDVVQCQKKKKWGGRDLLKMNTVKLPYIHLISTTLLARDSW